MTVISGRSEKKCYGIGEGEDGVMFEGDWVYIGKEIEGEEWCVAQIIGRKC